MTLRARLALAYLALLALCLAAFGVGVYTYLEQTLHRQFDESLRSEASSFQAVLSNMQSADLTAANLVAEIQPTGDSAVQVMAKRPLDKKESVVYKSQNFAGTLPDSIPPKVLASATVEQLGRVTMLAQPFKSLSQRSSTTTSHDPVDKPKVPASATPAFTGRVIVARPLSDLESPLNALRFVLIGGGIAVLGVATIVGLGLSTAMLAPLARMRATAQRIGDERDFSRRMPVAAAQDELGRLSISFNQMLAELEQAHEGLSSALEAQRRFVADASHELRTPLSAIRTNVEFVSRAPEATEEDRRAALLDALTEMRRIEGLVADLLALARLESARPSRRPVRVDHLVRDLHRDAIRVAPASVEVVLRRIEPVLVSGDLEDLRRAIWNLLDNAIKYTGTGRVEVALGLRQGEAEIEVRDTGMGIAPEELGLVFDRFWRAPGVRGMEGSGLGLAISKWVAQAHGGTVDVRSAPGLGTVFTIRLPALPGSDLLAQAADRAGEGVPAHS